MSTGSADLDARSPGLVPGPRASVAATDAGEERSHRGLIEGLSSPVPLARLLPAVLQADPFAVRFTEGLDEVLAPVFATLDCLEAYFDPELAPPDFLEWLTGWVGLAIEEHWSEDRRRAFVGAAVELYRQRGTVEGLRIAVSVLAGVEPEDVEITESGATVWSPEGDTPFPGSPSPSLQVRVRASDPGALDLRRLDAAVERNKPVHVSHTVEVIA